MVDEAVAKITAGDHPHLIIDLDKVTFLSSKAIGELVRAHVTTMRKNGKLVICGLNERVVRKGPLVDLAGLAGSENAQGESQKKLDVLAEQLFVRGVEWSGLVGALASEEMEEVHMVAGRGRLALVFDPLDGSSNLDVNVAVGSIFSVLELPEGTSGPEAVLQPGTRQVAAGYAIYGPSTDLVLTVGSGTHGFTLDREIGTYVLTRPGMSIPEATSEYAINASKRRFWDPPVTRYVDECKAGRDGLSLLPRVRSGHSYHFGPARNRG